jgi:hypothetical protein
MKAGIHLILRCEERSNGMTKLMLTRVENKQAELLGASPAVRGKKMTPGFQVGMPEAAGPELPFDPWWYIWI